MRMFVAAALAAVLTMFSGVNRASSQSAAASTSTQAVAGVAELQRMTARFAPSDIGADVTRMAAAEKQALRKLVEAARLFDGLDTTPLGRARLHYFLINKGPWSRLDHNAPFIPGVPEKRAEANYYPAGATKDDVEKWIASLPQKDRSAATGFFTTIRRQPDGVFAAVPYLRAC